MHLSVTSHNHKAASRLHSFTSPKKLVYCGLLTAVAVVLGMLAVYFPIRLFSVAPFLLYDPADVPIIIGTLLMGAGHGLLITVAVSLIMGLYEAGIIGAFMHIASTGLLVVLIAAFYHTPEHRYRKVFGPTIGALYKYRYVLGAVVGTIGSAAVMVGLNLLVTPLYMGIPVEQVVKLLAPAIIPFNLIKSGINSVLSYLVFAALSPYLRVNEIIEK